MTRLAAAMILVILLGGCAAPASNPMESKDRAECKEYARALEHSGRMKDACLISRGYLVSYSSNGGGVEVRSKAEPRQTRLSPPARAAGAPVRGRPPHGTRGARRARAA